MKFNTILLSTFAVVLIWSAINPHDYFTWFLEIAPAIIGLLVLVFTYKKFTFTNLTYFFILLHCCILFIGGHYTYAEVPLFNWLKEVFHHSRNNYDKVGHYMQGFVPAMVARELLIRKEVLKKVSWLPFLTVCICMAISVAYEFLEWLVAIGSGESAESFLGTQGYIWDTQSDMLYATIGAICMLLFLSKIQNKQIEGLAKKSCLSSL